MVLAVYHGLNNSV